jgi:hypothetical protein
MGSSVGQVWWLRRWWAQEQDGAVRTGCAPIQRVRTLGGGAWKCFVGWQVSPIIGAVGPGLLRPVRGLNIIVKCGAYIVRWCDVRSTRHHSKLVVAQCGHVTWSVFERRASCEQGTLIDLPALSMRDPTNFPNIFAILFDFLFDVEARYQRHSLLLQHRHTTSCPASHSLMLSQGSAPWYHPRPPDRLFYGTHVDLQCAWFASEITLAQPFDCIQSCYACVNLDHRTSSAAQAPTASRIYLEHRCCWGCSNLAQFSTSYVL